MRFALSSLLDPPGRRACLPPESNSLIQNAPPKRLIIEQSGRREVFEVLEDNLVIGRDEAADLQLDDHKVSRKHAQIVRRDGTLHISDLGSSNGTFVNGLPIFGATELTSGDKVDVGGNVVVWIENAPEPAPRAATAKKSPRARTSTPAGVSAASPSGDRVSRSSHSGRTPLIAAGLVAILVLAFVVFRAGQDDPASPDPTSTPTANDNERAEAGSRPGTGTPKETGTEAPELPAPAEEDLLRDFELAVVDARFGAAWTLLERLHQDRGGALKTRLDSAMNEAVTGVKAEASRLKTTQGANAARVYLKRALKDFPAASTAHTELTAMVLALPTKKPTRPVVVRDDPPATKPDPDERKTTPKPSRPQPETKPVKEDVMEKARVAVAAGDAALRDRRFKEAEAHFLEATSLLEEARGPNRHRRRALRGIRRVAAQVGFVDTLIESAGKDPSGLGRIPHIPGESGHVIRIDHEGVTFTGKAGPVRLAWRVLPQRAFVTILKKAQLDPKSMVDGAAWLRDYGADDEAEKLLVRAYRKDKQLKPRIDQALADARQMPIPEKGFTLLDDQWFSPRELARKRLNEIVDGSVKAIKGDDADARDEAVAVLMGLGDSARSSLYRALRQRKEILKTRLSKGKATASIREIGQLRAKLDEARDFALELIFDTEKYPYPYRPPRASQSVFEQYRKHQPIVDERVAAVRKIWNDERSAAVPDSVHDIVAEIRELNRAIRDADFGEPSEDPSPWIMFLPERGVRLGIRNVATSLPERKRIDQSAGVVERNEKSPGVATRGEIAQCRITNEYRLMMGRWAVRLYDPLVKASHGHCEDMSRLGFFSHTSPVPGKRSPYDRVVKAGMAPSGASENIAMNSGPLGAHNAWVHSPGHHRNILGRSWRLMGPGNVGRYWCQNFSVSDRNVSDAYEK